MAVAESQIGCRLVGQDERRFSDHGASDGNSLLLPAGQLGRTAILESCEPNFGEQFVHFFPAPVRRDSL